MAATRPRSPPIDHPTPVVLNVGITGHRAGALPAPLLRKLTPVVDAVFRRLRDSTLQLQQSEAQFCSVTEPQLRLHTAMATGADQIAATSARSSGYFVRAVLPFKPDLYREDFAPGDEADTFDQALSDADEIVALPGDRADLEAAYVGVGRSLVEAADVMIAIWDGEAGRGPGGTAHVVELALESCVPVIHVDIDRGTDRVRVRALVSGGAPKPLGRSGKSTGAYESLLKDAFKINPTS